MSLFTRVARATLGLTASHILVRGLSLVCTVMLTRWLAPDAYGIAAMGITFISIVSVIALAGADMSYSRGYHASGRPTGAMIEVFIWRHTLGACAIAGLAGAVLWWFVLSPRFGLPSYLAPILAAGIALSMLSTMAQTRTRLRNEYRRLAISTLMAGTGALALTIAVAYRWASELPLVLSPVALYVFTVLMLGLPNLTTLRNPSQMSRAERASVLKVGLAGVVTAPAFWILSSADRWILGYFHAASAVGVYSVGFSVATVGIAINNSLHSVWLPEVLNEFEKQDGASRVHLASVGERLVAFLGIVWLTVTAAGGDLIVWMLAPSFAGAAEIVPLLAAAVFFNGVLHLANVGLLLRKKLAYAAWAWVAGVLVCLLANALLTQRYGQMGAAFSQMLAFLVVAGGIVACTHREFPLTMRPWRLVLALAVLAVMGLFMHLPWQPNPAVSLAVKFPVGVLLAAALLRFLAPRTLHNALELVRRRVFVAGVR